MKKIYKKNDIWLCYYCNEIVKLRIIEICKGMIRHKRGWESGENFNKRTIEKWGKRIFLFGFIPFDKKY